MIHQEKVVKLNLEYKQWLITKGAVAIKGNGNRHVWAIQKLTIRIDHVRIDPTKELTK